MDPLWRVAIVWEPADSAGEWGIAPGDVLPGLAVVYHGSPQGLWRVSDESAPHAVVLAAEATTISLARRLAQRWPAARLLWAVRPGTEPSVLTGLQRGVRGVVRLPATPADLLAAVDTVVRGGLSVDGGLVAALRHELQATPRLQAALDRDQALRQRLQGLLTGLTAVAAHKSVNTMLPAVVELAQTLCHAQYAAMAILDADDRIETFITRGLSDAERRAIGPLPHGRGLLGEVIHTRRPLRVPSIERHPSSSGFPPSHPPMESFLGMPMLFQDEVVGHLYCTNREGGPFTGEDEELLGLLARHAGVLIHTARLTQELEDAVVAGERQRISMELHDGTLQALYGIVLSVDSLLARDPDGIRDRQALVTFADRVTSVIESVRQTVQNLRASPPDLLTALQTMVDDLSAAERVRVQSTDTEYRRLSSVQIEQVVAWAREAVSNAIRHAYATQIDVTWQGAAERFRVSVTDDGVGFDVEAARHADHFGLTHLETRAAWLGGRVVWDSTIGMGTEVTLDAPWALSPADAEPAPERNPSIR